MIRETRDDRKLIIWRKKIALDDAKQKHKGKKPVKAAQKVVDDMRVKLDKNRKAWRTIANKLHAAEVDLDAALIKYVPADLRD